MLFFLDIDECSSSNGGCHANASCQNTVGSFTCACNLGYGGDGFNCAGTLLLSVKYVIKQTSGVTVAAWP